MQVLLHTCGPVDLQKIEVFAPILAILLNDDRASGCVPCFSEAQKTVFLLLNPLSQSISTIEPKDIVDKAGWSRQHWIDLQRKRDELKRTSAPPEEVEVRVDLLVCEAEAWRCFSLLASRFPDRFGWIEPLNWKHFEFKHLSADSDSIRRAAKTAILIAAEDAGLRPLMERFFGDRC